MASKYSLAFLGPADHNAKSGLSHYEGDFATITQFEFTHETGKRSEQSRPNTAHLGFVHQVSCCEF